MPIFMLNFIKFRHKNRKIIIDFFRKIENPEEPLLKFYSENLKKLKKIVSFLHFSQ